MITYKQGDTFAPTAQYLQDDGETPASLAGYTITSQIRDQKYNLVETLTATITDAALGQFIFTPVQTDGWPLGTLLWDIRYNLDDVIMHTETAHIKIVREVTEVIV